VSTWAVLVAAGRGERLGGDRPKAFIGLGKRVLLAESLERLEASEWIDAIVVVVPEEWEEPAILLAEELNAGKVNSAVAGGATRADSVRAGVAEIPDDALIALVHDAARPLLREEVIGRVLGGLGEDWDGVVAGVPLADTVKRVDQHGRVAETVDRSGLYAIQTPQAFAVATLRDALLRGGDASDCAGLVEAAGGRVRVVEGDPRLVKITTASDLAFVETLLANE
jgi:2-C-methyl-D-erythritol 4-phosphate cytidylyltransferase